MILFFGCWGEAGHYLRDVQGREPRLASPQGPVRWRDFIPWGTRIDGGLAPRTNGGGQATEGLAAFHQNTAWVGCPGEIVWCAISWWDNSVDSRPGSSATFLADHRCSPAELLAEAREAFPEVFARLKYEVQLPGAS